MSVAHDISNKGVGGVGDRGDQPWAGCIALPPNNRLRAGCGSVASGRPLRAGFGLRQPRARARADVAHVPCGRVRIRRSVSARRSGPLRREHRVQGRSGRLHARRLAPSARGRQGGCCGGSRGPGGVRVRRVVRRDCSPADSRNSGGSQPPAACRPWPTSSSGPASSIRNGGTRSWAGDASGERSACDGIRCAGRWRFRWLSTTSRRSRRGSSAGPGTSPRSARRSFPVTTSDRTVPIRRTCAGSSMGSPGGRTARTERQPKTKYPISNQDLLLS